MTDIGAEAIAKLLEGVTPGSWYASDGDGGVADTVFSTHTPFCLIAEAECEANARFIAAARELVPALAARVADLETQVADLSGAIDAAETEHGLTSNGNMWRWWSGQANEATREMIKARIIADKCVDFLRDLADAKPELLEPRHYVHPADEPDPAINAHDFWAFQEDAALLLKKIGGE